MLGIMREGWGRKEERGGGGRHPSPLEDRCFTFPRCIAELLAPGPPRNVLQLLFHVQQLFSHPAPKPWSSNTPSATTADRGQRTSTCWQICISLAIWFSSSLLRLTRFVRFISSVCCQYREGRQRGGGNTMNINEPRRLDQPNNNS